MQSRESALAVEYEIELVINRQIYKENHIAYEVYEKVNTMILKDICRLAHKAAESSPIIQTANS